ncbi:MAG: hypothetical protein H6849_03110 [Alphaproteobacteria bacterium]|nr:MAG: hypothetical protein H6849_03110 [Alphaproteobacteria bacterium]
MFKNLRNGGVFKQFLLTTTFVITISFVGKHPIHASSAPLADDENILPSIENIQRMRTTLFALPPLQTKEDAYAELGDPSGQEALVQNSYNLVTSLGVKVAVESIPAIVRALLRDRMKLAREAHKLLSMLGQVQEESEALCVEVRGIAEMFPEPQSTDFASPTRSIASIESTESADSASGERGVSNMLGENRHAAQRNLRTLKAVVRNMLDRIRFLDQASRDLQNSRPWNEDTATPPRPGGNSILQGSEESTDDPTLHDPLEGITIGLRTFLADHAMEVSSGDDLKSLITGVTTLCRSQCQKSTDLMQQVVETKKVLKDFEDIDDTHTLLNLARKAATVSKTQKTLLAEERTRSDNLQARVTDCEERLVRHETAEAKIRDILGLSSDISADSLAKRVEESVREREEAQRRLASALTKAQEDLVAALQRSQQGVEPSSRTPLLESSRADLPSTDNEERGSGNSGGCCLIS